MKKRILLIFVVVLSIFLVSCSGYTKTKVSGTKEILNKLDVGMTINTELAENVQYSIVNGKIGCIEFEYEGNKFVYQSTTKCNINQLEQINSIPGKAQFRYLVAHDDLKFSVYPIVGENGNEGTVAEWTAELESGTYKAWYILYTFDYVVEQSNLGEIEYVLNNIIGM